jgi:hypothetical protein
MPTLTQHDYWAIVLGAAGIVLGLVAKTFYPGLPGPRKGVKPLPRWLGRVWFFLIGSWFIYLGLRHVIGAWVTRLGLGR